MPHLKISPVRKSRLLLKKKWGKGLFSGGYGSCIIISMTISIVIDACTCTYVLVKCM